MTKKRKRRTKSEIAFEEGWLKHEAWERSPEGQKELEEMEKDIPIPVETIVPDWMKAEKD